MLPRYQNCSGRTALAASRLMVCILAGLLILAQSARAAFAADQAKQMIEVIKITLKPDKTTVYIDETPTVTLLLFDAYNNERKAPKEYSIRVEVRTLSGELQQVREVAVNAGESSAGFSLEKLKQPGAVEIKATHRELLAGGTFIYARSRTKKGVRSKSSATPEGFWSDGGRSASFVSPFSLWTGGHDFRPVNIRFVSSAKQIASEPAVLVAGATQVPSAAQHVLTLRASPGRRMLADGKDVVEVCALLDEPAETETRVFLSVSDGELAPKTLVIAPNAPLACASLVSNKIGTVLVKYDGSMPKRSRMGKDLPITFVSPVTRMELKASPSSISLIDSAKISVTFFNGDTPAPTSEERDVAVEIDSGSGDLEPVVIKIPEGSIHEAATFMPKGRGPVRISAITAGFPIPTAELQVTGIPALLLGLTLFGGFSGGLIAYWVRKHQRWWRVVIGVVTGFVFYWALIFGILPGLRRGIVLNEISAYVLTALGGWLGIEVFSLVLNKFGVGAEKPAPAKAHARARAAGRP